MLLAGGGIRNVLSLAKWSNIRKALLWNMELIRHHSHDNRKVLGGSWKFYFIRFSHTADHNCSLYERSARIKPPARCNKMIKDIVIVNFTSINTWPTGIEVRQRLRHS